MPEQSTPRRPARLDVEAVRRRAAADPETKNLVDVLTTRAQRHTAHPTVSVPGEPLEWWYPCWDRLGDVAFAEAYAPDPARARWLREEVLRLCALPDDEWIGPFFRLRLDPSVGTLETAHAGLAVATVLELLPGLFDAERYRRVTESLVRLCLLPCERALLAREDGLPVTRDGRPETYATELNNHYWVLLDAFGAVALLTGDTRRIATLPGRFRGAQAMHNADGYGEGIQYWGYAATHLTNLHELLVAFAPEAAEDLPRPDVAMLPWLTHAVMFTGGRRPWGSGAYTTMVNFGDSALTGRPPADALTSIARFAAATDPSKAGLARHLFTRTYADADLEPSDLGSFGFLSQPGWRTVVNLLAAAAPYTPEEAALPVAARFETGPVVVRDRWEDPRAVLAAQAGHGPLAVDDAHRHEDEGSFVLGFGGEVFFTDPGHCCYRLRAQREARGVAAHGTWTLRDPETGEELPRSRSPRSAVGRGTGPVRSGGATVFGVDLADLYPGTVRRARRTWISLLPHVVLVVDDIATDRPVRVDTRFILDDRDNRLRVNQAMASRLVLRRGPAAAKFFRLAADADGRPDHTAPARTWTAAHDIYLPYPNAPTQGKEGSAVVYTFSPPEPATRFRALYSIVLAAEDEIRGWHVAHDGDVVTVSPPAGPDVVLDLPALLAGAR